MEQTTHLNTLSKVSSSTPNVDYIVNVLENIKSRYHKSPVLYRLQI